MRSLRYLEGRVQRHCAFVLDGVVVEVQRCESLHGGMGLLFRLKDARVRMEGTYAVGKNAFV